MKLRARPRRVRTRIGRVHVSLDQLTFDPLWGKPAGTIGTLIQRAAGPSPIAANCNDDDVQVEYRSLQSRPSAELRQIDKALGLHPHLNTRQEKARRVAVRLVLSERRGQRKPSGRARNVENRPKLSHSATFERRRVDNEQSGGHWGKAID